MGVCSLQESLAISPSCKTCEQLIPLFSASDAILEKAKRTSKEILSASSIIELPLGAADSAGVSTPLKYAAPKLTLHRVIRSTF